MFNGDFTQKILEELSLLDLAPRSWTESDFNKHASVDESVDEKPTERIKVASAAGQLFIKTAHDLSRDTKIASDGSIWAIETDEGGEQWLVRNFLESEVNEIATSLI